MVAHEEQGAAECVTWIFQVRCSNVCLTCELWAGLRRKRKVKLLRAREVGVHVHPLGHTRTQISGFWAHNS